MAFDFPPTPVLNDVYTDLGSGISWQWNGTIWTIIATPERPRDFVKIDNGTISSPVDHFDIALSGSYSSYRLICGGLLRDAATEDILYAALSFDNGSTYLEDAVNFDSYGMVANGTNGNPPIIDKLMYVRSSIVRYDTYPTAMCLDILPGSLSNFAQIVSNDYSIGFVNENATVPATPARATNVKITQFVNTDSFVAGYWTLYGVN